MLERSLRIVGDRDWFIVEAVRCRWKIRHQAYSDCLFAAKLRKRYVNFAKLSIYGYTYIKWSQPQSSWSEGLGFMETGILKGFLDELRKRYSQHKLLITFKAIMRGVHGDRLQGICIGSVWPRL